MSYRFTLLIPSPDKYTKEATHLTRITTDYLSKVSTRFRKSGPLFSLYIYNWFKIPTEIFYSFIATF